MVGMQLLKHMKGAAEVCYVVFSSTKLAVILTV
jgi:hypothetical protein